MRNESKVLGLALAAGLLAAGGSVAKVTQDQADRLGKDLTPEGGEMAGNAAGTIPKWEGGILQPPPGYVVGMSHIDPFDKDPVKFTITAANMGQYAANMTEGQMAMLKTYPTYKFNIYMTRRSCNATEKIYAGLKANALNSELANGGVGITGALLASPFPIPGNDANTGLRIFWNHRLSGRQFKFRRWQANAAVTRTGDYTIIKSQDEGILHYAGPGRRTIGDVTTMEQLNNIWVTYLNVTTAPARLAGNVVLVYETIDQVVGPRQAWQYNPGTRRVLRAPELSYDNPQFNADGLATIDEFDMWNGSPDRYDFKLIGKEEKYIAYNAFQFQSANHKYAELLGPNHLNQDLMRYELHRVWHVEATLKPGMRHVYAKREAYSDEDTWRFAHIDEYDTRNELWRVHEGPIVNWYDIPFCYNAAEVVYDLQSGRYLVNSMRNEEKTIDWNASDIQPERYTPDAIRRLGVR